MDPHQIAVNRVVDPQANAHGAPLRIHHCRRLCPGGRDLQGLGFEHLAVAAQQGGLAGGPVGKLQTQAHIHRAASQAVGDLLGEYPAVHPDTARQGQLHRTVGHCVIVLLRGGNAEIQVQPAGGRLVHRLHVRLLPILQTAHRGGHGQLSGAAALALALAGHLLLEGQIGHRAHKYPAGGVDQLQLGQIQRHIPAPQMAGEIVHLATAEPGGLPIPAQPNGGFYRQIVLIVVAAQLHVELAAVGKQLAVHIAEGLGPHGEFHGVHAPLLLPALPVLQTDPAVFALHKAVFALQRKLHRRRLFMLHHQHLGLEFLPGTQHGGQREHQDQVLALVEHRYVFPSGGLQQTLVGGGLRGQEQAVALPGQVKLPLGAHLGSGGVHRLHVLLGIGEAEIGVLAARQGLLSLQHLQLAEQGLRHHDLPALVIQGHAALDHQGGFVAGSYPQAAYHAGAMDQPVEQRPLGAVVPLLHLKVPDGEQLAVKVPVALKGEIIGVIHGWLLRSWYRNEWSPARQWPQVYSRPPGS